MHSKTITSLLVAAAAGITNAAPVDTPVGDYTWKISKFSGRKPEGTYYSSISFNIKATNGGLLDFECAASAAWLQDDVFLTCGPNSGISFAWENEYNGLIVKFGDGANARTGTTTVPTVCRAGGAGPSDQVCEGVADAYVTLVKGPSS